MIGRAAIGVLAALLLAYAALVAFSPITPIAWTPSASYLAGDACAAAPSIKARLLATGLPGKPDGLAFAPDGRLLAALSNGEVAAIDRHSGQWSISAAGGGFLTGLAASRDGTIYAVDERAGTLLAATPGGGFKTLVGRAGGTRLSWANDVAIAADGRVYFTTTATGRSLDDFYLEVLEHRGSGLLVRYDPATGSAHIEAERLNMANGVAVLPDGGVLVAESAVYGVSRFHAGGKRGGAIEGLPGFTGNVRASDRAGAYWLTLLSPRSGLIDRLARMPSARRLLAWLPAAVRPGPVALPCVIQITADGERLSARAFRISGVEASFSTAIEREGKLYLSPASIVPGGQPSLYVGDLSGI